MSKNLVIVESPAKANTIKKYLGKDFQVLACYGHVRDLLPKGGAVDTKNNFSMKWKIVEKNQRHIETISKALKKADALYLATDPDREGEAISWHLYEILKERKLLDNKTIGRVVFHEITKRAINEAMAHPRELSMDLVNAQQARRALDYLVGFNLSPLLWKKIRRGLSAGRVQSPALRMIVERELEIEKFKAREYWTIEADVTKDNQDFIAKLTHSDDKKLTQFTINNTNKAHTIATALSGKAAGKLLIIKIEKKQRKRNPAPPFTTSTLQQEAARKLGFGAQRTMRIAQQLYEGIAIDGESTGLISYMRTDSVNLAQEAIEAIRDLVSKRFGKDNLPKEAPRYKTKARNAQEAHEAIRPTAVELIPESIEQSLSKDQFKLYNIIWKRTVACQMIHAIIDTVGIDLSAGEGNIFRASGSTIRHPGFMSVYQEGADDTKNDEEGRLLPVMAVGEIIELKKIRPEQHFTEPPPRFTEATLIKTLEEYGIGRPSTYAAIISTLQQREYAVLEKKRFIPTDVGRIVNKFLTEYFSKYVDYEFTAHLEDELDAISRGEHQWIPLLRDFWVPFDKLIHITEKTVDRKDVTHEILEEKCPTCGQVLSIRLGKRGRFIGCTAYPDCDYTRDLNQDRESSSAPEVVAGRTCPKCGSDLVIKHGRYGKFIGCGNYPNCRHIESLQQPTDTGVGCPKCLTGSILKRTTRKSKTFYSCSRYPDCEYALWNEPVAETCPKCSWPILTLKTTKRRGSEKLCPQSGCRYSEAV